MLCCMLTSHDKASDHSLCSARFLTDGPLFMLKLQHLDAERYNYVQKSKHCQWFLGFFLGLFRTVRIKVSEVFTLTCLVSTVITLKLLNLICKWISDPKWNCHLYTISALFHCRTGFASAAASPSESANEQLPEKESASKIKTARRSRISTSSPPASVFSCHYLVPVTRVSRFSAGQHPRGSKQHM